MAVNDATVRVAVVAVTVAILVAGATWLHFHFAERRYQPTIDNLNQLLGSEKSARQNLNAAVTRQNAAISALQAKSIEDKQRIADLTAKASQEAGDAFSRADEVLQERNAGPDLCGNASAAFDAELRKERRQ